jgi:uncharacterized tellurite resistance protein B-like protein
MLDVFRRLIGEFDDARADAVRPALAVAALLAEASHRDGEASAAESVTVERMLVALFDLDPQAAAALRVEGARTVADAPDLVRFTRVVKTGLTEAERVSVLEALWAVVLQDGRRDPREDALMRQVVPLLGLSDRDSALARRRILGSSGS